MLRVRVRVRVRLRVRVRVRVNVARPQWRLLALSGGVMC